MKKPARLIALAIVGGALALLAASAGSGGATASAIFTPQAIQAPGGPVKVQASWLKQAGWSGCTAGGFLQCYIPSDIREAYGVDQLSGKGDGQTIVLVDAYGDPAAAHELQVFHDAFFASEPNPNFDEVYPLGNPPYKNVVNGKGQSGPSAAAGWASEAALDVQWSYAIAPHAHIVLLATPPAETLGVQGFPNLMKAISGAIDTYPAGTVFSMSLATPESDFGGAAAVQTAKFDQVFQKGIAKGDSFFGASGDDGTNDLKKQHNKTAVGPDPAAEWPSSSPYVTSVGGTQLQFGWTWNPQSDTPFDPTTGAPTSYFNTTAGGNTNVVWNESWLPAATGGGPSAVYPLPSWQSTVSSAIPGNHRGLPDVSWNAAVNGAVLVELEAYLAPADQGMYLIGGTSAATPQVAALTALVNQSRHAASKAPVGNLSSLLYSLPASAFNDVAPIHQGAAGVVSGDMTSNKMFAYNADGSVSPGPVAGWPVLSGYDMTTGRGTPWAPNFVADLTALP